MASSNQPPTPAAYDLRGVPCPLNWARAKARLESMRAGETLLLITDVPRAERDIPAAVEAEGWVVLELIRTGREVRILIER